MTYKPEDFQSDTPPPRPIGTECEYNFQAADGTDQYTYNYFGATEMAAKGVANHGGYLGSEYGSGRAYLDAGRHLEFCTAEAIGPASAALENITGIERARRIVEASNEPYGGLYRLAGTNIPDGKISASATSMPFSSGTSSGYHENFLIPRRLYLNESGRELVQALIPTILAGRLWAGSGTLSPRFVMSQKVGGIGGYPIEFSMDRRTNHAKKPMALIATYRSEEDTIGDQRWARLETRFADPGQSLVVCFASLSLVSLGLRLIEQRHRFDQGKLLDICLDDPVVSAYEFAHDLTLQATGYRKDGKEVTALDTQESLLDILEPFCADGEVQLPEDEVLGLKIIRAIVDSLRASRPAAADYSTMAMMRVEFAAKHVFITEGGPQSAVRSSSPRAMGRLLLWDQVLPEGYGRAYWKAMTPKDPATARITGLANQNGILPRAIKRAGIVDGKEEGKVLNWAFYRDGRHNEQSLGYPV